MKSQIRELTTLKKFFDLKNQIKCINNVNLGFLIIYSS